MKNFILSAILILSVLLANEVFASPELTTSDSGLGNYQVKSSDENSFDPTVEAQELEQVISNKIELSKVGKSIFRPVITGINDPDTLKTDSRICPYCWVFLGLLTIMMIFYGEHLKSNTDKPNWFLTPLVTSLLIYIIHAVVHIEYASGIFLDYYAFLVFDLLLVSYFYFSHFILKKQKLVENYEIFMTKKSKE